MDRKYKTKNSNYRPGNALNKLGEKIASKLIGQDPKTNEIPKRPKSPKMEKRMTVLGVLPTGKKEIY